MWSPNWLRRGSGSVTSGPHQRSGAFRISPALGCDRIATFLVDNGAMTSFDHDSRHDSRQSIGRYHLDIAFDGANLLLKVDGPHDPKLREHVAEVTRAAAACGLQVTVTGDGVGPPDARGLLA